ncbi:MAG: radical SAM protein [Clostridia bacterium]|nr:radical SAM protein [Clostridia bacterium]
MQHCNIPIFIPHMGCPNQCVFCNQRSISGRKSFDVRTVREEIERALQTIPAEAEAEIAFFGGSFTGIDRDLMISLLRTAQDFVDAGRVSSIRLSTRPDYLSEEILGLLSRYSVRHIELGLQSMSDRVLAACRRGHTAKQARWACRAVKAAGFSLVGQMMIGLPESTPEEEEATAREICALGADAARIYPTVVFYDTPLCALAQAGDYTPLSCEEAAKRSARALRILCERGVPCIRIGLCASEELVSPETVYAGPNHPALGELVWNAYYFDEVRTLLAREKLLGRRVILSVPEKAYSKVIGQHRANLSRWRAETGTEICRVIADKKTNEIRVFPEGYRNLKEEQPCI